MRGANFAEEEEALLSAARSGPEAFTAFYRRFERSVLRFFVRATGRADLAADLTAETFARVLESIGSYDPAKGRADQWLFGIARNVLGTSYRRGRVVLNGNGIAGARLGEPEIEVVSLLSDVLGKPRGRFVPNYICGGADVAISWQDLTTFFRRGRFLAYSYWEQQVVPMWWPLLDTARGLTIGETPAYARRLYGRAFRTSKELGGTWFLTTPDGTLDGFTYGESFGPGDTITTIQAGSHICETVTPQGLPR